MKLINKLFGVKKAKAKRNALLAEARELEWRIESLKEEHERLWGALGHVYDIQKRLKDSFAHQRELAQAIQDLNGRSCPECGHLFKPWVPSEPEVTDPDFEAAMAKSAEEDAKRGKP